MAETINLVSKVFISFSFLNLSSSTLCLFSISKTLNPAFSMAFFISYILKGQTLFKKVFKIRVVSLDSNKEINLWKDPNWLDILEI